MIDNQDQVEMALGQEPELTHAKKEQQQDDPPTIFFTGGGIAAGKSTSLELLKQSNFWARNGNEVSMFALRECHITFLGRTY